ncbi:hypothetical protein IMCC3317_34180 [Kordia antarctica]|uniref:Uncharacterized protein n=1 Tax=Kordia antarctica TaxID=1218801 RepID=A0A7L4ZQ90_9FLAO|nr:hypothetical protein [Kordia antarctica]QHI38034.1 hypothetical protein IMCC3317_34180 [Kordia antarctica]
MLSSNKHDLNSRNQYSETLINTLESLYKIYSEKDQQYYGLAYYMLLAECDHDIISKIMNRQNINLMIIFYKKAYFDNFWSTTIYESIEKIIYKSSYHFQKEFVNSINEELPRVASILNKKIMKHENFYYLSNLIEIASNYGQKDILNILIPVLTTLKDQVSELSNQAIAIEEDINTEDQNQISIYYTLNEKETWGRNTLASLFSDLTSFSDKELALYRAEILAIYNDENTHFSILKNIISRIISVWSLVELEQQYESLKNFQIKNIIKLEDTQEAYFEEILKLAENLYVFINHEKTFSSREKKVFHDFFEFFTNYLFTPNSYSYINDFFIGHLIDVIIISLAKINTVEAYNFLFSISEEFDAFIFSSMNNETTFNNYVNLIFEDVFKTSDNKLINKLIIILKSAPNIRYNYLFFRESIFKLFKLLINDNFDLLVKENKKSETFVSTR